MSCLQHSYVRSYSDVRDMTMFRPEEPSMSQKSCIHSFTHAVLALMPAVMPVVMPVLLATSAQAEVPAPYNVASNQVALVTVRITTTDSSGSQFDEESMVVPVTGNGSFGLLPAARPFTFAEMKAGSTLNFGGGTLNFQLLCGLFGCIPVTVSLNPTTATLVANAGAAIVSSGRADFGSTWNLRGNYTTTTPFSSSPGTLDTTSVAPFGTTFTFDDNGFIGTQLTIGAIEGDLDPSSFPPGTTARIRTTVSFGTTFIQGPYYINTPPNCGIGEPCNTPHEAPGCAVSSCCTLVCATDPSCCNESWDSLCVNFAVAQCGLTPENDRCESARPLGFGRFPFTTLNTDTDGPLLISECWSPTSGSLFTNDVWFRVVPPVSGGLAVSTCNHAGFDTNIVIYGSCGGVPLACNDNDSVCTGSTSRLIVPCEAGELYLIRVGGKGVVGTGEIDIALGDPAPVADGLATQWPMSQGGNDHWYAVYSLGGTANFKQATAAALALGGYPASITSAAESEFIRTRATPTLLNGPTAFGLQQAPKAPEPDGGWGWWNGEPLVYTNWNVGEPNNVGRENWGMIYPNGKWNDDLDAFGNVLIEFDSDPNLSTATWPIAEGGNGSTYQAVLLPNRVTWLEARDYAASLGGQLVSIETQAEMQWVFQRFVAFLNMWTLHGYNGGPWVGLSRDSGKWRWQSGAPVTDSPWLPGEPNASGDYACFYAGGGGPRAGLDDTFDGNARRALIIEYAAPGCPGDIDNDGMVSASDLSAMLGQWGTCPSSSCAADVDQDGQVSASDLGLLLGSWGTCP